MKLLSEVTNQQTVSSAWFRFTACSLLPFCLRAAHTYKATKRACDWPAITWSYHLLSWGPCHRRKNTLAPDTWQEQVCQCTRAPSCSSHGQGTFWSCHWNAPAHLLKYHTCSPDPHHTMGDAFILIRGQWCARLSCHIRGRRIKSNGVLIVRYRYTQIIWWRKGYCKQPSHLSTRSCSICPTAETKNSCIRRYAN